jgi:hypothetical protein
MTEIARGQAALIPEVKIEKNDVDVIERQEKQAKKAQNPFRKPDELQKKGEKQEIYVGDHRFAKVHSDPQLLGSAIGTGLLGVPGDEVAEVQDPPGDGKKDAGGAESPLPLPIKIENGQHFDQGQGIQAPYYRALAVEEEFQHPPDLGRNGARVNRYKNNGRPVCDEPAILKCRPPRKGGFG